MDNYTYRPPANYGYYKKRSVIPQRVQTEPPPPDPVQYQVGRGRRTSLLNPEGIYYTSYHVWRSYSIQRFDTSGMPNGDIAQTLPFITQAASGSGNVIGTGAQTLPFIGQQASGEVVDAALGGTIRQVLPFLTQRSGPRWIPEDPMHGGWTQL